MRTLDLGEAVGPGVPTGGTANQVLVKNGATNFDTSWKDASQLPAIGDEAAAREAADAALADGLAIIANGDTHAAVAAGQAVFVRSHSTLAAGLYWASSAIGTNAALSTSNLTADNQGGLNKLKGDLDSLNSKITAHTVGTAVDISGYNTASNKYTCPSDGYIRVRSGSAVGNVIAVDVDGIDVWTCCIATNKSAYNSMFVRAGMQVYVYVNEGTGTFARFSPLT